jgi:magnesium-transporting ATPase (P-type)
MKGAPEVVRKEVKSMLMKMGETEGTHEDNSEVIKKTIDSTISEFTSEKKKYRTIMIANKIYKLEDFVKEFAIPSTEFPKIIKHFNEGPS